MHIFVSQQPRILCNSIAGYLSGVTAASGSASLVLDLLTSRSCSDPDMYILVVGVRFSEIRKFRKGKT
jgi:hypothetical protein